MRSHKSGPDQKPKQVYPAELPRQDTVCYKELINEAASLFLFISSPQRSCGSELIKPPQPSPADPLE